MNEIMDCVAGLKRSFGPKFDLLPTLHVLVLTVYEIQLRSELIIFTAETKTFSDCPEV